MPTAQELMAPKSMFQETVQDPETDLTSEFPKPDPADRLPVLLGHQGLGQLYLREQDLQDLGNDLQVVDGLELIFLNSYISPFSD
jgi:hypothetical protein